MTFSFAETGVWTFGIGKMTQEVISDFLAHPDDLDFEILDEDDF